MLDFILAQFAPNFVLRRQLERGRDMVEKAIKQHKEFEHSIAAMAMKAGHGNSPEDHAIIGLQLIMMEDLRAVNEEQIVKSIQQLNTMADLYASRLQLKAA